jgi:predicted 3-demethylubiquinone-9 3-methyltransferase (glyoxalase superfamily)
MKSDGGSPKFGWTNDRFGVSWLLNLPGESVSQTVREAITDRGQDDIVLEQRLQGA